MCKKQREMNSEKYLDSIFFGLSIINDFRLVGVTGAEVGVDVVAVVGFVDFVVNLVVSTIGGVLVVCFVSDFLALEVTN